MSNFDSDGYFDNDWDDRGDLAWNEFDWERFLQEQDQAVHRYLAFYETLKESPERVDEVAHRMGWDEADWTSDEGQSEPEEISSRRQEDSADYDLEPYTLQRNPIYIATKAIYLSLQRGWEETAAQPAGAGGSLTVPFARSLFRGESHALLAVQALDIGDYGLAICQFKRALAEVNHSLSLIPSPAKLEDESFRVFRALALPRLFDLREIWLRVINECRSELDSRGDEEE